MPRYFVSLTGPLLGLWCAIYNPEAFESYGAFTLHKVRLDRLPFDYEDYEHDLREHGVE